MTWVVTQMSEFFFTYQFYCKGIKVLAEIDKESKQHNINIKNKKIKTTIGLGNLGHFLTMNI